MNSLVKLSLYTSLPLSLPLPLPDYLLFPAFIAFNSLLAIQFNHRLLGAVTQTRYYD